jgi:oligopeptidase B
LTQGPPKARIVPRRLEKHGHVRTDDYFWLRERDDPEVTAYLDAENAYFERVTAHTEPLRQRLFEEIVGRIKKDDETVPFRLDDHYYYVRFEEKGEYPIHCRKPGSLEAAEEVMLDVNELAEGHDYFAASGLKLSSARDVLAFAVDAVGRRVYTLRFKNLTTGEILRDEIPEVTGNHAWAEDNRTLFYTKQDLGTLRWHQIWRHELGTDPERDVLVYEETDERFLTYVMKTKSKKFLLIGSSQTLSEEYRFLDAANPGGEFAVLQPREADHEYSVDHFGDHFYIRTNWKAKNFRLVKTPLDATGKERWTDVIPHRDDVLIEGYELFRDHLVVEERRNGLVQLRVLPWSGNGDHYVEFAEPAYFAWVHANYEFDTSTLRYGYTSLATPPSVYDYEMDSRKTTLMKRQEVLGGFDASAYATERLHATARDGAEVPISLVYRRDARREGGNPLLLYGYGSYGASTDATFASQRLSLLDRGFVFAIAHVRGGEDLGREWYENGKLFRKKNTFTDFIDCAELLLERGYAAPGQLFARGGSAGGLLIGAVVNMRPELWKGAIAVVPFVDVVTTMLDDSIPLTAGEYDEWGNPNERSYYDYILSYSPYDNVEAKSYPNLLVTTGLHDSQVQYWEPAKWVAKLRAMKTDDNVLLLHTNMGAGHSGATGRFKGHRDTAREYAFLLDLNGDRSIFFDAPPEKK